MSTYAVSRTNGIAVSTGSASELAARTANGSAAVAAAAVAAAVVAMTEDERETIEASALPSPTVAKPGADQSHMVKLTKREIEVLTLVIEGNSSKEVADILYVSKRTVDFHLANIYHKLGVTNRVQAFREATRRGLISFNMVSAARQ